MEGHQPGEVFKLEHGEEFVVPMYSDQVTAHEVSILGKVGLIFTQADDCDRMYIADVDPNATAWQAGIRPRMALLRIDGVDVRGDPKHLVQAAKARGQKSIIVEVLHPRSEIYADEDYEQTEEYSTDGGQDPLPPNYDNTEYLVNVMFDMFDTDRDEVLDYNEFAEMQRAMDAPVVDEPVFAQAYPGGFTKDDFRVDIARSKARNLAHFKRILYLRQREAQQQQQGAYGYGGGAPQGGYSTQPPPGYPQQQQQQQQQQQPYPPQQAPGPWGGSRGPHGPGAAWAHPPPLPPVVANQPQTTAAPYSSHYYNSGSWQHGAHGGGPPLQQMPDGPLPTAWGGQASKKTTKEQRAGRFIYVDLHTTPNNELKAALVKCAKELENRVTDVRTSHEVMLQGIDAVNQESIRVLGTDLDAIIQEPENTTAAAVDWAHDKLASVFIPPDAAAAYDVVEAAKKGGAAAPHPPRQPSSQQQMPHGAGVDHIVQALTLPAAAAGGGTPASKRGSRRRQEGYASKSRAGRHEWANRTPSASAASDYGSTVGSSGISISSIPPRPSAKRRAHRPRDRANESMVSNFNNHTPAVVDPATPPAAYKQSRPKPKAFVSSFVT